MKEVNIYMNTMEKCVKIIEREGSHVEERTTHKRKCTITYRTPQLPIKKGGMAPEVP